MDFSLSFRLEEPLLAGDRKSDRQVAESLDHIPGAVIRAAFARQILAQCPYFDASHPARNGRHYWVTFQDGEACAVCPWRAWCAHFSQIQFRNATPLGAWPLPLTAMGCKDHEDHPLRDTLVHRLIHRLQEETGDKPFYLPEPPFRCAVGGCGGRMEGRTGFRLRHPETGLDEPVRVQRRLITRVGMDVERQVSAQGALFSHRPIAELLQHGERLEPTVMKSLVSTPEGAGPWNLPVAEMLIGARVSQGLGRVSVTSGQLDEINRQGYGWPIPVRERLERFHRYLTALWESEESRKGRKGSTLPGDNWLYVPLLLVSEVDLGLAEAWASDSPAGETEAAFLERLTAWLRQVWMEVDGGVQQFEPTVLTGVLQYRHWAGWAWSRGATRPSETHLRIRAGSVFVVKLRGSLEEVSARVARLEQSGLGERRFDGYGQVIAAHPIHFERGV